MDTIWENSFYFDDSFIDLNNSITPHVCWIKTRYGQWFKTRLFGNVHVYVPTVEGAKTVFSNDFVLFNKGYLKSMGDMVGKKSLLRVPHEIHGRMRRLLSDPFSMKSVSKFVPKFDRELCARLDRLERAGKSFRVLEFTMKVTIFINCIWRLKNRLSNYSSTSVRYQQLFRTIYNETFHLTLRLTANISRTSFSNLWKSWPGRLIIA